MRDLLYLFQYSFVQNAFLAGTCVAITTAALGYFMVLRAQSFAGEALSDIGFAGAAGAALLGVGSLVGMFLLTILAALGMGAFGERLRGRDVEIGMVLSFALGLGVLFLAISNQSGANATAGVSVLFGSVLSVTREDVWIGIVAGCVTLLLLGLLFRPLLFASIDPEVAATRGVPIRLLSLVFLILLAITIAQAVLVVGALLVLALLICPAASALRFSKQPLTTLLLAIGLGLAITWGGLLLALVGPGRHLPVGFFITALAALCYFASLLFKRLRRGREQRAAA